MSRGLHQPIPKQNPLGTNWWWKAGVPLIAIVLSAAVGLGVVRISPLLILGMAAGLGAVSFLLLKPFIGLLLYLTIFIVRPQELYPELAVLHLERLIGALTLAALVAKNLRTHGSLVVDSSPETKWLLAFVAGTALTVPTSYWPTRSMELLSEILKILVFYIITVQLVDSRAKLRGVVAVYVILILYIGISTLQRYYTGHIHFRMGIERAVGETLASNDPNHLAATLACTFPLFMALLFYKRSGWMRWIALAGAGIGTWTLALTGSRSGLLGFLVGVVYLWWRSSRKVVFAGAAVVILALGYIALPDQYRQRYDARQDLDDSSRSRITAWTTGVEMFLDRPLTGVGIGCFPSANAAYTGSWLQPHSLYVQVLAETGLIGSVPFFAFLGGYLLRIRRVERELRSDPEWGFERIVLYGILGGTLVLLATGVFGHSLLRRTWYFYGAIAVAAWRLRESGRFFGSPESLSLAGSKKWIGQASNFRPRRRRSEVTP